MYEEYFENLNNLDEDIFFEMANAVKEDTGLPYNIWLDSVGKNRKNKHSEPRIKVEVDNDFIPVIICDNPYIPIEGKTFKKFSIIKKFIIDNKDILLQHWNKQLTDKEILNLLDKNNKEIPGQMKIKGF